MFVALFVANMPDNCGAFFSDICLAKTLVARGHSVILINCGEPRRNLAGGVYEGLPWKPYFTAGRELDQSQIWISPHFPVAPLVRRLNATYKRPVVFTLHFSGAPLMFRLQAPVTWKEAFWYVNETIPKVLLPQGFPPHVVHHARMAPFVNPEDVRVPNPGEGTYITLINANMNKGLKVFLEIAKRMPDHKFLAVRSYYHAPTDPSLEVTPNITWIDFGRDVRSLYAKTRILLVPSAYESYGMVAVEAMINGIPVLYTRPNDIRILYDYGSTEGMEEWIAPAGIACDMTQPDDWVARIQELDDPEVYAQRSKQVREHIEPLLNNTAEACAFLEKFSRENPVRAGTMMAIQNSAPREQAEVSAPVVPPRPTGPIGWRNGRLSVLRR